MSDEEIIKRLDAMEHKLDILAPFTLIGFMSIGALVLAVFVTLIFKL